MPRGHTESLTQRSARSYAHLQRDARRFDAERFDYLAKTLEAAGIRAAADLARRWSREHAMVAGQLNRLGSVE